MTKAEYSAMLRRDFGTFAHRCLLHLNPSIVYQHNWHIDAIAAALMAAQRGETNRVIVNVPPRSLKSILTSVALPAFILGHEPTAAIIAASYGQDLADKLSRDCRNVMTSDWYEHLFPASKLAADRQAVHEFETVSGGYRMATSVDGVLTGRGADWVILDDPLKPDEAVSETQRTNVNDWYAHTLLSRLNNKATGKIVIVMQRLHLNDLVGHVLDQPGNWKVLSLPAIAEQDQVYVVEDARGIRNHLRRAGEVLHPEREPLEILEQLKQGLGSYNFAAQYQQSPVPLGGGMVKVAWLVRYDRLPERLDQVIQSWDTATKDTELADYSVCVTVGIKDKVVYLLDVFRRKMNYPELKRAVIARSQKYQPTAILIEDKSSGTQLAQELVQERVYAVKAIKPEGDKQMRMYAQTATIENGLFRLPKEAPWLDDYVNELTSFPKAKHDDQVDATSQLLEWIKLAGQEPAGLIAMRWIHLMDIRKAYGKSFNDWKRHGFDGPPPGWELDDWEPW